MRLVLLTPEQFQGRSQQVTSAQVIQKIELALY